MTVIDNHEILAAEGDTGLSKASARDYFELLKPRVMFLVADVITAVIVANIWLGIPFNLVILYAGLQNIPGDIYEAASLDGAGPARTFRSITLPLLRPVSAITLLLGLIYTLKVVDVIWIILFGVLYFLR